MKIYMLPYQGLCKIPGAELGPVEVAKFLSFYYPNCYEIRFLKRLSEKVAFESFRKELNKSINENEPMVIFGGDHATTSYIFNNLLDIQNNCACIIFDAHNDYYFNKMEQMHNWNVINYIEEYIKEGMVIGYRDNRDNMPKCEKFQYFKDYCNFEGIQHNIIKICEANEYIYLSIDVDAINPVEFPGTGYKCAGGLFLRELIKYIEVIKEYAKKLIIDIVEFNPLIEKDISLLALQRIICCIASK